MSLATFKKKTINQYSNATKRSGVRPGGYWLPSGPFSCEWYNVNKYILNNNIKNYGAVGFSINGAYRNISVGKDNKYSSNGTRYKGLYPCGHGGKYGRYNISEPILNAGVGIIGVSGFQYPYIKQSTLSNKGMLNRKLKPLYSGQYPNNWVQPIYTGNQTDTKSQNLYIHDKSSKNDCVDDINNVSAYENNKKLCNIVKSIDVASGNSVVLCNKSLARGNRLNLQQSNAPYTKNLYNPKDSSLQTLKIQRSCVNPKGLQKPFPYEINNGTGILHEGLNVSSIGNSCNNSIYYKYPPLWYIKKN